METPISATIANDLYSADHMMYTQIHENLHSKVKNKAIADNLTEAVRRMNMFVLMEKEKLESYGNEHMPIALDQSLLLTQTVGLGTPSQYKKSLEKGYMCCKTQEIKSVNNWYVLTTKGFNLIKPYLFLSEIDIGCQDFPKFVLRCTMEKLDELNALI